MPVMEKLVRNQWVAIDPSIEQARILNSDRHPEGLDVLRLRFVDRGRWQPSDAVAHVVSVIRGSARLGSLLRLEVGTHTYLPPGSAMPVDAERGCELVCVSAGSPSQARGKEILVRDEAFLCACAVADMPLRWILTPQYLSRRGFLHHDPVLLSKSGKPVSWVHTTMFDVSGLP